MRTHRAFAVVLLGVIISAAALRVHAQDVPLTIEVHAKRFAFTPSEITLKVGETVKIVLISDDATHALVIPGLNVRQEVTKGHPAEITITPDTVGDFPGMCGHYCGVDHGLMTFTVHVVGN